MASAFMGLILAMGLLLGEGVYVSAQDSAPWWTALVNVGAGAPLAIISMGLFAIVRLSRDAVARLEATGDPPSAPDSSLSEKLWREKGHRSAWRSARLATLLLLLPPWLASGALLANRLENAIVTPTFTGLAIALALLIEAGLLLVLSPIATLPIARLMLAISKRERLAFLSRPLIVLAAFALSGVAALAIAWSLFGETLDLMPWALVIGPITGIATALVAALFTARSVARLRNTFLSFLAACVALGLFALLLPDSMRSARGVFVGSRSATSAWMSLIEERLDFDEDGAIGFYGGGDCAPHDPLVCPSCPEKVGNGVDDDCVNGDLRLEPTLFLDGPKRHPRPEGLVSKPNIVLVTTDALSFGHMSASGYHRAVTPAMDELAQDATSYVSAFSTGPSTRLAFPALVAGIYHPMLPLTGRKQPFGYGPGVKTIAEIMKARGYRTVHVTGDSYFKKWRGFSQGFATVEHPWKTARDKKHPAPEVAREVVRHIEESTNDSPLFLWVHFFDHHGPYSVPKGAKNFGSRPVDRYDSELLNTDAQLKLIFDSVKEKWRPTEYVLFFTSDHGEAFDKNHPKQRHAGSHNTNVLHVPFIVQAPWSRGKKIDGLVSHFDIIPTIANLAGAPPRAQWPGESLVHSLEHGVRPEKKSVYSLTYLPGESRRKKDPFKRVEILTDEFHYFYSIPQNRKILVRWRADPLDEENLYEALPEISAQFDFKAAELLRFLRDNERGLGKKR